MQCDAPPERRCINLIQVSEDILRITFPGLGIIFMKFTSYIVHFLLSDLVVHGCYYFVAGSCGSCALNIHFVVRSCRSWLFKVCSALRSWRYWILGYWGPWILFFVSSWDSRDPGSSFFGFVLGSWGSWILNFCFVVRSWRAWIPNK